MKRNETTSQAPYDEILSLDGMEAGKRGIIATDYTRRAKSDARREERPVPAATGV